MKFTMKTTTALTATLTLATPHATSAFSVSRPSLTTPRSSTLPMTSSFSTPTYSTTSLRSTPTKNTETNTDTNEELSEVEKLRAQAAKLRQEAAQLEAQKAEERARAVEKAFEKFDTNHDGSLTLDELKAALEKTFKLELPEERVERLLQDFDTSGDGKLQKDEMVSLNEFRNRLELLATEERRKAVEASQKVKREEELTKMVESQMDLINDKEPTGTDKILSVLPYLFPLMDGLVFGQSILAGNENNPIVAALAFLLVAYRSIPFSGFLAFFALSAFSGNLSINRLIRFNMQQAIFLDIALFVPGLLGALTGAASNGLGFEIPLQLAELSSEAIFVSLIAILGYSTISSLLGKTPDKVPFISNAVNNRLPTADQIQFFDMQTGEPILRKKDDDEESKKDSKGENDSEKKD